MSQRGETFEDQLFENIHGKNLSPFGICCPEFRGIEVLKSSGFQLHFWTSELYSQIQDFESNFEKRKPVRV